MQSNDGIFETAVGVAVSNSKRESVESKLWRDAGSLAASNRSRAGWRVVTTTAVVAR